MKSYTVSDRLFIDTWGWLVLANDADPSHRLVRDLRVQSDSQGLSWVTTDYVLDETVTRLFASTAYSEAVKFFDAIFRAQELGSLAIETIGPERFQAAWKLRLKYKDKPRISFTDLTSFVVMREIGVRHVLTGDAHFRQAGLGFQPIP